jgi:hypothetical protein
MQKQLGVEVDRGGGGGGGGVKAHLLHQGVKAVASDATGIAAMTAKLSIARNFFILNSPVLKKGTNLVRRLFNFACMTLACNHFIGEPQICLTARPLNFMRHEA